MRLSTEQVMQLLDEQIEHYYSIGDAPRGDILDDFRLEVYREDEAWTILDTEEDLDSEIPRPNRYLTDDDDEAF